MVDENADWGFLGNLLGKVGFRGMVYNLGGRKMVTGGGALGVIALVVQSDMSDWPKAVVAVATAIVAVGVSVGIGVEDAKKKG